MEEKMTAENESMKASAEDESVKKTENAKASWSSAQVYTMSVVCLLVGLAVGFLLRGSTSAQPVAVMPTTAQPPAAMGGAAPMNAMPGMGGGTGAPVQPTPDQMKQMADKKVAPLLDQLKQNPQDVPLILKIGGYYMAAQQFDEAQKYFQQAVNVKATPETLTRLSNAEAYAGQGDKAMETLNQALKLDPKYANALFNLGMLKWQVKGDLKGAIQCWETLVKTNPQHPRIEEVKRMIAEAKEHQQMPASPAPAKSGN